jgi:hypothetical protein
MTRGLSLRIRRYHSQELLRKAGAEFTVQVGNAMEQKIGKITHYFQKIGVAVILLEDNLDTGNEIHILGKHTDFHQKVTSMQIEHQTLTSATKGQDIGLKVIQAVHVGDEVFRVA